MKFAVFLLAAGCTAAPPVLFEQSAFDPHPAGWTVWGARPEITPKAFVDRIHSRGGPGSLALSGASNAAAHGGWEHLVTGVQANRWYRLSAHYRAEAVPYEPLNVLARLEWMTGSKRAGQPSYAYEIAPEGEWKRVGLDVQAPADADRVKLQLYLSNSPLATVWWDDIKLEEIPAPPQRLVRVAAINDRPSNTKSAEASVSQFLSTIERAVTDKADIILLPEGITVVGTGKKYRDVAESIPGPTTDRLAEVARRKNAWIVAGIYEREAHAIYNTAVLINRQGNITGKYRKVYLPREEIEAGLTPGSSYPVFQTDFGKVGLMICYDVFYADPARHLALKGAEMILMPIWGGNEILGKARAIENRVFIASSGYDYPTYIQDPNGETLAVAQGLGTAARATIDLNRRYPQKFLGEMRERLFKELRLDLKVERPGY